LCTAIRYWLKSHRLFVDFIFSPRRSTAHTPHCFIAVGDVCLVATYKADSIGSMPSSSDLAGYALEILIEFIESCLFRAERLEYRYMLGICSN